MTVEPEPTREELESPTFDKDKRYWCRGHDFVLGYFVEYVSYNEAREDRAKYRIYFRDLDKLNKKLDDMSHEDRIETFNQLNSVKLHET